MPKLLEIKARTNIPVRFQVEIRMGDGKTEPPPEAAHEANALLKGVKKDLQFR